MSRTENYAWWSLGFTGLVLVYFFNRMIGEGGIVPVGVAHLVWTVGMIIVATIVFEIVYHSVVEGRAALRRRAVIADERDLAIAAKAAGDEHVVIVAGVVMFVGHVVFSDAFPDRMPLIPQLDLVRTEAIVFCLLGLLLVGDAAKHASTIARHRLGVI